MSLAPVPSEQDRASCPNCSAALAPDQRYCLSCGQPVSSVRLAFLDVLQSDSQPYGGGQAPAGLVSPGYPSVIEPSSGVAGWMRRYSGVFGLLTVLLMSIIVGLLVGHWITQSRAPGTQVVKVEGLATGAGSAPGASAATPSTTTPATTTPNTPSQPAAASKASAKTEASEAKEATAIEKAPTPEAVKVTPTKLQKLGKTTGKQHTEEVNKLGSQPIETG